MLIELLFTHEFVHCNNVFMHHSVRKLDYLNFIYLHHVHEIISSCNRDSRVSNQQNKHNQEQSVTHCDSETLVCPLQRYAVITTTDFQLPSEETIAKLSSKMHDLHVVFSLCNEMQCSLVMTISQNY